MSIRRVPARILCIALPACALSACNPVERGPVRIDAIGDPAAIVDPNRAVPGTAAAMLLSTSAQGLVRFDGAGEIEPALAQSWIVSDDGLRYTFRIRRALWTRGAPVTAAQVVERLQSVIDRRSRNPLKDVLGVIDEVEAMTDQVLEIRLKAPRPHFLQLLAQPEMAILRDNEGTGPYRIGGDEAGALRLVPPAPEDTDDEPRAPDILLRGIGGAQAIARFTAGDTDFVSGGTIGDVPLLAGGNFARTVAFDPAGGLFGLAIASRQGPMANADFRRALAMAVDREAIANRFELANYQGRVTLLAGGIDEYPQVATPDWAGAGLAQRRAAALPLARSALTGTSGFRLRVAMPDGLGYRLVFAHLRRDWAAIGVDAVRVPAGAEADLRLIDVIAPAELASWYLRHFTCENSPVCDPVADTAMEAARMSRTLAERRQHLAEADRALTNATAFIALGAPIRWSLRAARLNGFRANPFARHAPINLIQTER